MRKFMPSKAPAKKGEEPDQQQQPSSSSSASSPPANEGGARLDPKQWKVADVCMWVTSFKPHFGSKTQEIVKAFERNVSFPPP